MTESKPREFWIYSFKSGRTQISESKVTIETQFYAPYDDPTRPLKPSEVIHAIEHSAFEQLQKENELLKRKLDACKVQRNDLIKIAFSYINKDTYKRTEQEVIEISNREIEAMK